MEIFVWNYDKLKISIMIWIRLAADNICTKESWASYQNNLKVNESLLKFQMMKNQSNLRASKNCGMVVPNDLSPNAKRTLLVNCAGRMPLNMYDVDESNMKWCFKWQISDKSCSWQQNTHDTNAGRLNAFDIHQHTSQPNMANKLQTYDNKINIVFGRIQFQFAIKQKF